MPPCATNCYEQRSLGFATFPRMLPSASLSQGTVFIARVGRRYRVWEVAH